MLRTILITLFSLFVIFSAFAQEKTKVIQFSGLVVTEDNAGDIAPLPYTNVSIMNSSRGTITEIDGFFSLVAETGDTIIFSRVGFKSIEKVIPDTLSQTFYSWYQVMSQDSILLPTAVIYPWPSREHYKLEFLALDVDSEMRALAEANLAEQLLDEMRFEVAGDGREAFRYQQQKQVAEYQYSGQFKPMNIFNPVAWSQFVKAWKRGDFKRKDKKKKKN